MSSEGPSEPLIDALLEETLGGVSPPDLSTRILSAWATRQAETNGTVPAPPFSVYEPLPPPVVIDDSLRPIVAPVPGKTRTPIRRRSQGSWWQVSAALATAAAVLAMGYLGFRAAQAPHQPQIAQPNVDQVKPKHPAVATHAEPPSPKHGTPITPQPVEAPSPAAIAKTESPREFSPLEQSPDVAPTPTRAAKPDAEVVAFINEQLQSAWKQNGVTPSPAATDAEWCRRTFLRIVGRIPTVEELRDFTENKSPRRHEQLVDRLLTDSRYAEEYAQHWAEVWANVLLGRAVGKDRDDLASREGLEQYLRESLLSNKPYDRMALELISATGSGQPGADNFNGAANFLLAHATDDAAVATARTCRVFLGVQLQCVQCHDHPTAPLRQNSFWAMNAFFRQMKVTGNRNDPRELIDQDYLGHDGHDEAGLVFYELPNGIIKAAAPAFLDGTPLPVESGRVSEVNRREALAKLVVQSQYFSQAAVNRLWSQFLGYGFTRPVDNIITTDDASHPEILAGLAEEFAAHRYDLKSAMRWIALSDAFNRSSQGAGSQLADMPEAGTTALFSRYYTRQLPAEEVFRSLQIAAKLRRESGSNIEQARIDWLAQARKSPSDDGPIEPEVIKLNASLVKHATTHAFDNMLHTVSRANLKFEEKVEHLFLAALSRKPTRKELKLAENLAGMNRQNEAAALEDIWWALLNSNEFILDH
jgi:hypothetical protein